MQKLSNISIFLLVLISVRILFELVNFSGIGVIVSIFYFLGLIGILGGNWWGDWWIIGGLALNIVIMAFMGFSFIIILDIILSILAILDFFKVF